MAHAFAVKGEPLSIEDEALLDRLAAEVAKRRMQAPAILFLESVKPLNFVGSQALVFLQPLVGALFSTVQWERVTAILERREALELLIRRIEGGGRG
mgnify:CR=1 FL=1